ncbi:DUF3263 domain-containing protein [Hoyosella sp. G463]|uniref:DUF3263 domain-containing protein n=1 Tax=Lolliginicoccus lacisalsi TaxID=2742202 RepID=A0A927JDP4_9ACTN|nr:DUF3263 domain-containing protein [Lolliginicoccus lacisalsi]MBD8507386.1 DUF3263 domain-containing protein [Lolliginicoccus lacisalsi]
MDSAAARDEHAAAPEGNVVPMPGLAGDSPVPEGDGGGAPVTPGPGSDSAPGDSSGLSERDLEVLAFERQWWKYAGAKEEAIKNLFGLSATRYYQLLNTLLDRPEALRADPMLVKRLRRLRSGRQKARTARRLGMRTT